MAEWAEAPVREQLIERFELVPAASLAARLKALTSLGIESGAPLESDFALPAEALAMTTADAAGANDTPEPPSTGQPDPRFRLSPRLMIEALRRGDQAPAEAMFAAMAGIPMQLVRRFVKETGGASIAVAARAIGMAREEFATIYFLWKKALARDGLVAAGELGAALDLFDTMPQDRVEAEVETWRNGGLAETDRA